MAFILASASPRRLDLLTQINRVPDAVVPADIDETPRSGELPRQLVARLAAEKAAHVASQYTTDVVLAADTVVACGRRILPKPADEDEACRCLDLLSGRRHRVYGGVSILAPEGVARDRVIVTQVTFKRLSDRERDAYVETGEWRGKAGAYAIQGRAGAFIKQINGSYTNVVGLCVYTVEALLANCLPAPPSQ